MFKVNKIKQLEFMYYRDT